MNPNQRICPALNEGHLDGGLSIDWIVDCASWDDLGFPAEKKHQVGFDVGYRFPAVFSKISGPTIGDLAGGSMHQYFLG